MKPLRPNKKWVLAAIGLLLVLLIAKTALFLAAKPKVTVDYIVEYNKTSRPQNYEPDQNAAPYYQKAYDTFVDVPDELKSYIKKLRKPYINWPTDFNNAEQALLEKWLISNTLAFEYFREALSKPYYWLERKANKDNYIGSMTTPDLAYLQELTEALTWDAKLKAVNGQFQSAFESILNCYKAGNQKCCPNLFLIEQHVGLRTKTTAIEDSFIILDRSQVDNKALKFLQDNLQEEIDNEAYIPSIQAENFLLYDALQRLFIDNGKGTGRLAWSAGFYITLCAELDKSSLDVKCERLKRRIYCCFVGPTRNEIKEQIKKVTTLSDKAMTKTPWQIQNEGDNYLMEIRNINKSNFFLEILGINPESIFFSYHKTKSQTNALIAVLAILRYKAETGIFPESLDKLVFSGYLQGVPRDPYSNKPLVYKGAEDDFMLYSVGANFEDDNGASNLDNIYWSVQKQKEETFLSKYKPQEPNSYSWYPNEMKEALKRNQETIRKRLEERGSVPPKR
jgi:hypothetical protein